MTDLDSGHVRDRVQRAARTFERHTEIAGAWFILRVDAAGKDKQQDGSHDEAMISYRLEPAGHRR
jgi:hypothetical protein